MGAVQIVTIQNKIPLFKGEEKAERIELIQFEENGFEVVAQKDLYQIGDQAIYIQPDYCLSDLPIFESFLRPNGDVSKSMLGKIEGVPRRIRAKKFNFHRGDDETVYSNGILLPTNEVLSLVNLPCDPIESYDWDLILGITKYVEPEDKGGGMKTGAMKTGARSAFPEGIYKTDEPNIHTAWSRLQFPVTLVGLEKADGSSISLIVKDGKGIICSRNMSKPLTMKKVIGKREKTWYEKLMFWKQHDLLIREEVPNDDDFVRYGKPYLDKMLEIFDNIVLRAELCGGSMKGSGNKLNPESKNPVNLKFFGLDRIEKGIAHKRGYEEFVGMCNILEFPTCKKVFIQEFNSRDRLLKVCNDYFKEQEENGRVIEGIVVRTLDSKFSAKIMNLSYDSKK